MTATAKVLASQGCDNALVVAVQTMTANLIASLTLAKNDADRQDAVARLHNGILLCKAAHQASLEAVAEIFVDDGQPA
jgi:hypothetical protein